MEIPNESDVCFSSSNIAINKGRQIINWPVSSILFFVKQHISSDGSEAGNLAEYWSSSKNDVR